MKISVIGTGYVGLVSGVCLAEKGHHVVCVDVDPEKVEMVRSGKSPIHEKGLDELLQKNTGQRLTATTDIEKAVIDTELSLIAVGTPFDGSAIDVSYIRGAARDIGKALAKKDGFHAVVVKSTVVPGTTDEVVAPIVAQESGKKLGVGFGVAMNPEFLREGESVGDFMEPDRIVYGTSDARTQSMLAELYAVFPDVDKVATSARTAEMIKYTANSLLATLISFSNEIGNLCAALGDVDVAEVMQGVHLDRRLSPILEGRRRITPVITTYLEAGCGFGGSCFPKDVKALIAHGRNAGQPMPLLESVIAINRDQPNRLVELVEKHLPNPKGKRVAVLGLAFKPGTDDMRESPSIPFVQELARRGADLVGWDPVALSEAEKVFAEIDIRLTSDLDEAVRDADALVIVTRWPELEALPDRLDLAKNQAVVIDGRRMLDKTRAPRYDGIGLGVPKNVEA